MAKTKPNIEDEEVKTDVEIEEATVETSDKKEDKAPVATVSTGKKNVKIRVVEDVDCIIACKPYKFAKDKEVSVSSDVAAILCYAKKAYRL